MTLAGRRLLKFWAQSAIGRVFLYRAGTDVVRKSRYFFNLTAKPRLSLLPVSSSNLGAVVMIGLARCEAEIGPARNYPRLEPELRLHRRRRRRRRSHHRKSAASANGRHAPSLGTESRPATTTAVWLGCACSRSITPICSISGAVLQNHVRNTKPTSDLPIQTGGRQ